MSIVTFCLEGAGAAAGGVADCAHTGAVSRKNGKYFMRLVIL
jgi:hypothetical protein